MNNKEEKNIIYFEIIDNLYSLTQNETEEINYKYIFENFKSDIEKLPLKKFKKNNNLQLFYLDKNLINIFLFYKKNKDFFKLLIKKEINKNNMIIESKPKLNIGLKFQNKRIITLIYICASLFPLFQYDVGEKYLDCVLKYIKRINFCQRYYIYIILKSIYIHYVSNQKYYHFKDLTLDNVKKYYETIKKYLIDNSIIPNEEIFVFLKKILYEKDNHKKEEDGTNNFIFEYDPTIKYVEKIGENIITKKDKKNILIFRYKQNKEEYKLLDDIYDKIYSFFDYHLNEYFNLNNLQTHSNTIFEIIINMIYYIKENENEDQNMALFLFKSIIILKKFIGDLKKYKTSNNIENIDVIDNIGNNNNNNNNIDEELLL